MKQMIKKISIRIFKKLQYCLDNVDRWELEDSNVDFDNDNNWLIPQYYKILKINTCSIKPQYIWGILQGAALAKVLGHSRISVLEFGVAKGEGLKAMENIAIEVEKILGISIDVFGFDTGKGMPKPVDYRDTPNLFSEGEYKMEFDKLSKDLKKAKLFLGLIDEQLKKFQNNNSAPIAFVSVDVDYYFSAVDALKVFDIDSQFLLPRVLSYFDDIFIRSYTEFNGEMLAINDFNQDHPKRKIGKIFGLRYYFPGNNTQTPWMDALYFMHDFNHPDYNKKEMLKSF